MSETKANLDQDEDEVSIRDRTLNIPKKNM
jgi:hypothetical protein